MPTNITHFNNNRTDSTRELKKECLKKAEFYIKAYHQTGNEEYFEKAKDLYLKSQYINQEKENLAMKKPRLSFNNVGGLENLKEEIKLKIIEPLKNPDIYKYFNKKIGGGILMYGPPGCGKSLIAEATAGEANLDFFNVKASDIKSKYVGETEKNIATLFQNARRTQPCIIFFDEFESLGCDRDKAGEHDKNAISQLLTEMDGVGNKDKEMLFIAATNEPWNVDLALRRPGRFGSSLFVPPPDILSRMEIFKLQLIGKPLAQDVNLLKLAELTHGYSGADIQAVCDSATELAIRDFLANKVKRPIAFADFFEALKKKQSSVIPWFSKAMEYVKLTNTEEYFSDLIDYWENFRISKPLAY